MKPDNQPSEIKYIRGKLCGHCCEFILRYEPLTRGWPNPVDVITDDPVVCSRPRARRMNAVRASAEGGCWICNHLTTNALRDQNGDIYPLTATVLGYTINSGDFTVTLTDSKTGVIYHERFVLSTSKQRSDSTEEDKQEAAALTSAMDDSSKYWNGSVKPPRNAYMQGGAMKRKSERVSKGMLDGLR